MTRSLPRKMVERTTSACLRLIDDSSVIANGSSKVTQYITSNLFNLDREQFTKSSFSNKVISRVSSSQGQRPAKLLRKIFEQKQVYENLNRKALDLAKDIAEIDTKQKSKCEAVGVKNHEELVELITPIPKH